MKRVRYICKQVKFDLISEEPIRNQKGFCIEVNALGSNVLLSFSRVFAEIVSFSI